MHLRVLTLALLAIPLTLTGCDAIEEAAGLNDINVSLGEAGRDIPVQPNALSYQQGSVSISQNIPGSPGVDGISISTSSVSFSPNAPRNAPRRGGLASCDLEVTLLIDEAPAVSGTVIIADDVVTDVTVGYASPDYDRERLCEAINVENCPVGDALTSGQIDAIVEDALNSGDFNAGVVLDNPGDCDGTLDIDEVNFDLNL